MKQTKAQIREAKEWLAKGHSPFEVLDRVYKVSALKGRRNFIGQPGTNHELEAFTAGRFGEILGASTVIVGDSPDAKFAFPNGEQLSAEIVSADRENRKIAEEIPPALSEFHPDYLSASKALVALETACRKKLSKNYSAPNPALIIYLNGFWIQKEEHRKTIIRGTLIASKKFSSIFIHDSYGITRAWKNGRPAYKRWWFEELSRKLSLRQEDRFFSTVFSE
ncbi:MAG: hypothetical protein ACOZAA_16585 [Pseudomonadota bacterium]